MMLTKYSSVCLRIAIASVFLWFGFSQLKGAESWTRLVPDYVLSILPLSPTTLVHIHGSVEILLGLLLLLGLFTRTVALLLAINLAHITFILGYGPTGVRDFALTIATLAIFLNGADEWSIDAQIARSRNLRR